MPTAKVIKENALCVDNLRHAEYYAMQEVFDNLYARSLKGGTFDDLMDVIFSRENILLAYRNIKTNSGSHTPGTDHVTIKDIGKLTPEDVVDKVRFIVTGSKHGYRPRPVRRKDIPKPNGSTRPLGIPCMWDRLIQQCIKQVMEPICEAKFSDNSYGFRPQRSVENAISKAQNLMNLSHLTQVIEFDIKGFFDNVNHTKLIKQIWAMGIHDKHLTYLILRILKAPIKMPDGTMKWPDKGTPQGGIISPLLANIVLNELDHWVESNWQNNPVARKYSVHVNNNGSECLSNGYAAMKRTGLKEMFIVRYADDFRIFCRTRSEAIRTKAAVTQWLADRLKLEVSQEKTRIVNVKRHYTEFLGFKFKLKLKAGKLVVKSHMCDKAFNKQKQELTEQAKNVAKPRTGRTEQDEIRLYNQKVMGMQNYYCIATDISRDCSRLNRMVMTVFTNRIHGCRLIKKGRTLTDYEKGRYGKSSMLRYVADSGEPIYPVGYVQHKHPMAKKRSVNQYTPQGRAEIHQDLRLDMRLMLEMMRQPLQGRNVEYADNRISLFSAQLGKCAVMGTPFEDLEDIHCHHKVPRSKGGTDAYENLGLVHKLVHRLIHAQKEETIQHYKDLLKLNSEQMKKLNKLRKLAGYEEV